MSTETKPQEQPKPEDPKTRRVSVREILQQVAMTVPKPVPFELVIQSIAALREAAAAQGPESAAALTLVNMRILGIPENATVDVVLEETPAAEEPQPQETTPEKATAA